jgi:hypothetical protein
MRGGCNARSGEGRAGTPTDQPSPVPEELIEEDPNLHRR